MTAFPSHRSKEGLANIWYLFLTHSNEFITGFRKLPQISIYLNSNQTFWKDEMFKQSLKIFINMDIKKAILLSHMPIGIRGSEAPHWKTLVLDVPDGHQIQGPLKHRCVIGNGPKRASLIFQSKYNDLEICLVPTVGKEERKGLRKSSRPLLGMNG